MKCRAIAKGFYKNREIEEGEVIEYHTLEKGEKFPTWLEKVGTNPVKKKPNVKPKEPETLSELSAQQQALKNQGAQGFLPTPDAQKETNEIVNKDAATSLA